MIANLKMSEESKKLHHKKQIEKLMAGINYVINKALILFTFKIIVAPSLDPMNPYNFSLGVIHPYFKHNSKLVSILKVPETICQLFRLNSYIDLPGSPAKPRVRFDANKTEKSPNLPQSIKVIHIFHKNYHPN